MPSPAVIEVEKFLAPLTGPNPDGKRLPSFDPDKNKLDLKKIKEYRETVDPESEKEEAERIARENYSDSKSREEFMRIEMSRIGEMEARKPQWDRIIREGTKYLLETGKDMQVALSMTEALTRQHGFAGLRDSMILLRRLCDECWDVMHPKIDDPDNSEDYEMRIAMFSFLDEAEKTPFFPNTIREIFIMKAGEEAVSLAACRPVKSGSLNTEPKVSAEMLKSAINSATSEQVEQIKTYHEDCVAAIEEVDLLVQLLDQKIGDRFSDIKAPSLAKLKEALIEYQLMLEGLIKQRSGDSAGDGSDDSSEEGDASGSSGSGSGNSAGGTALGSVRTRADIYARLRELAALLQKIDPQSAVPPLVLRAVELGELSFADLVDQVTSARQLLDFMRKPIEVEQPSS